MLSSQKDLFYLDKDVHYLNNAYMSPNLKSVEIAGIVAIRSKNKPYEMDISGFFDPVEKLKATFSKIINNPDPSRIAIVPSASYGLANAAANIETQGKKNIVIPEGQFPSNYYVWERLAQQRNLSIKIIKAPVEQQKRGFIWNERLLDAIDHDTAVVACGNVHWADGTKFDLRAIREKCTANDAYMILDTSQSLGALPLDIQDIKPDALVNVGYKWLFGPYGIGFAYYNERFDHGIPIEENWINRLHSEDFKSLVNYQSAYKVGANRYCVGENSNFINVPMMQTALEQILAWDIHEIQNYSRTLITPYLAAFKSFGCSIEEEEYRGNHLLGIRLPAIMDMDDLGVKLKKQKVHVSMRGTAIRVSTSVYNTKDDLDQFLAILHGSL